MRPLTGSFDFDELRRRPQAVSMRHSWAIRQRGASDRRSISNLAPVADVFFGPLRSPKHRIDAPDQNCLRNRMSPLNRSRMSVIPWRRMHNRSTPNPNAKPVYVSGS